MYGWPAWNSPYLVPGQRGLLNNVRPMMPMQNPQQLYMGQYHQGLEHQVFPNVPYLMQHQMHDISHSLSPHHHFPYAQRNIPQNWQKISADRTVVPPAQNSVPVISNENETGKEKQREDTSSDQSKPESSSSEALNAVNIAENATKEMAPKNLQEEEKLNFLKEQAKNWQQQKQFQEEQQKQVQEQFNHSVLMYNQAVTQTSFAQPNVQHLVQQPAQQNAVSHQQVVAANVQAYGDSKGIPASDTTQRIVLPAVPTPLANVNKGPNANAKPLNFETSNIDNSPQQKLTTFKENVAQTQSNNVAGNSELSVLVKCLRDFEDHLRQWNEQFDEWRRQNKGHFDRQKYLTYEKQWLDWRCHLVERHLQMKELYHEQNSKLNQQNRWQPLADTKVENDFIVPQKHQTREQQYAEADIAFDNIPFRGREVIRSTEESFMPSRSFELEAKSMKDYSSNSGNLYSKNITTSKDDEKNKYGKLEVKEQLFEKWTPVVDYDNKESEMMELARLSGYVEEEIISSKVENNTVEVVKNPTESIILKTSQPKVNEITSVKSQNKESLLEANKDASELYDPFEEDFTVDVKKSFKVGGLWLNDSVEGLLKDSAQPSVEPKEIKDQSAKGVRSALLQTPLIKSLMDDDNSNFQSIEKQESNDNFNDRVYKFDDDCYVFFDDKDDALANNAPELFQRRDTGLQENNLMYEQLNRNVVTRNVDQVPNVRLTKDAEQQERKINPSKRVRVSRFDQHTRDIEPSSDQVRPHVERFDRPNQILESKSDHIIMPIAERFDRTNQILEPRVEPLPILTRFEQSNQILEPRFNQIVNNPTHFDQANRIIESRFDKPKVSRFEPPVELRSEISKENIRNAERFTRRTDVSSRTESFVDGPRHVSESRDNANKWVPVPFADEIRPNVEYGKCEPITEAYSKGDSLDNSLSNMPQIPITVGGSIARTLTFEEQEIIRQATEELKALQDLKELTKMLNTNVAPCSIPNTPPTSSGTNWKAPIDYECVDEAAMGVRKSNLPFEPFSRESSFCNRRFSTEISLSSRKVFDYDHKTIIDSDQKQNVDKPFRLAGLKSLDYAHGQVLKPVVEFNDKPFEDPSRCVPSSPTVSFPGAQANTDVRQSERSYDTSRTPKERTPRWEPVKEQPITRSTRNESFPSKRSREAPFKSGAVIIGDLIGVEGRRNRPQRIVIILRGPPGSSKSYVAKLIKDKEIENGGSAPRILSLDDYFMVETEKKAIDPESGKSIKIKVMEYEFEPEVEESYRKSLLRAFKKTVDDGFFPLIIVDAINNRVKHFDELHTYAKQKGFQVYICEMDMDPVVCFKRNIHNRTEEEITRMIKAWEDTPRLCQQLDVRSLLQDASITEVEMEDFVETKLVDQGVIKKGKTESSKTDRIKEDSPDLEVITPSKWEQMDATTERLDKLDGFLKAKRKLETPKSLEHYLQVSDDYEEREVQPGKKRVRWADIEEGKNLAKRRELGFVVGQTNWSHFTDPDYAQKALTRTKYI